MGERGVLPGAARPAARRRRSGHGGLLLRHVALLLPGDAGGARAASACSRCRSTRRSCARRRRRGRLSPLPGPRRFSPSRGFSSFRLRSRDCRSTSGSPDFRREPCSPVPPRTPQVPSISRKSAIRTRGPPARAQNFESFAVVVDRPGETWTKDYRAVTLVVDQPDARRTASLVRRHAARYCRRARGPCRARRADRRRHAERPRARCLLARRNADAGIGFSRSRSMECPVSRCRVSARRGNALRDGDEGRVGRREPGAVHRQCRCHAPAERHRRPRDAVRRSAARGGRRRDPRGWRRSDAEPAARGRRRVAVGQPG